MYTYDTTVHVGVRVLPVSEKYGLFPPIVYGLLESNETISAASLVTLWYSDILTDPTNSHA